MMFTKMFLKVDPELIRIFSLSGCFFLLFSGESTFLNMQKTIVSSIHDDRPDFKVEGYTVISLTYVLFAISVWFGPYVTYALGANLCLTLSATGYLCHLAAYAFEEAKVIYAGAIVIGIAGGILWPAQGHYMFNISSQKNTPRNVGIFWFILPLSGFFGNIFVYFTFYGKKYIDPSTRRTILYILGTIMIIAICAFIALPKPLTNNKKKDYGLGETLKRSARLMFSTKMLWLGLTFIYMGLQQSFCHGIYSPSVGFTLAFGNSAKQLVALSGMFMSIGFLSGALCPVLFSGWLSKNRKYRKIIVLVGVVAQLITYFMTYINLPNSAIFGNTEDISIIYPSATLAMVGSVLITFGDACLTTQVYSIIGDFYKDQSAEACCIFKFIKGLTVAASFYCSKHFGLHTIVTVFAAMSIVGVIGMFVADHNTELPDSQQCEEKDNPGYVADENDTKA